LELAPAAGVDCAKFNQNFRVILNLERKAAGSDYPEPLLLYAPAAKIYMV
jgi:hypothetical protein